MPLPLKAVLESQFTIETAGPAVPASGHPVRRVTFTNENGEKVVGWYKLLDDTYPEILAKISVAFGVRMRMALGKEVAEDRLVFDENGKILGTVSISVPDFKPMQCAGETPPLDLREKEQVCPSVYTLLEHNFARFIVAAFLSGDDDGHPGNVGLNGLIDHDMRGYRLLTRIIKGPRFLDRVLGGFYAESPDNEFHITQQDILDLPIVKDRAFWCAHKNPLNPAKQFSAWTSFQELATNPSIILPVEPPGPDKPAASAESPPPSKPVSFQEQLFYALLKELMVYDPEVLRSRLIEYLGDTPVDFMALGEGKSAELAAAYPELFKLKKGVPPENGAEPDPDYHPGNNDEPFVNIIAQFFQAKYDEFYKAVVFNPGCEKNSSGVPVPGYDDYLRRTPSSYRKVRAEMAAQNELIAEAWQRHRKSVAPQEAGESSQAPKDPLQPLGTQPYPLRPKEEAGESSEAPKALEKTPLIDAFCMLPESYYDLVAMDHRYHQIFRDAHILGIKKIIHDSKLLLKSLVDNLRIEPSSDLAGQPELSIDDGNLTQSWQLIGNQYITLPPIRADAENSLHKGAISLAKFINELLACSEKYYLLPRDKLTIDDNTAFYDGIWQVIGKYESNCMFNLGVTHYATDFVQIIKRLQQYRGEVSFRSHLVEKDSPLNMEVKHDYAAILARDHTESSIVDAGLRALFDWARNVDGSILEGHIERITLAYEKMKLNPLSNRVEDVLKYLKSTQHVRGEEPERGDNRLAFILSDGGYASNSLNTLLIEGLIPLVLKDPATIGRVDINLMSLEKACESKPKTFNSILYTKKAMELAVTADRFDHMHTHANMKRINKVMYDWVESIDKKTFKDLVDVAVRSYVETSWTSWTGIFSRSDPRPKEVSDCFKECKSNQQTLASIFSKGALKSSSLNTRLLTLLLDKMKTNISTRAAHGKVEINDDFAWFLTVNTKDPVLFDHILHSIQPIANEKIPQGSSVALVS
ncbi:MAG: hypothetical protein Q8M03_04410 [Legionella sp.]|nr:hypothetical protein [Legionella sp.]